MLHIVLFTTTIILSIFFAGLSLASELIIFPAKGQSEEQLEKDKYECYSWAKKQTGFDPMAVPTATEPPPPKEAKKGGVVRGAAGGAAIGAAVGAIDGDAGDGAAKGAAAGAIVGGIRQRRQRQQQAHKEDQWAQQQASQYTNRRNEYNRAYGACLEGKGYTVK